jgi:hypothetical protein
MFDPTAFENMKVVMQGALYDLDISGEIVITDRNDLINMAKMSRCFELTFELAEGNRRKISAKIIMESRLSNLAAELLSDFLPNNLAGCEIILQFLIHDTEINEDFKAIEKTLQDIWGPKRKISQIVQYNPLTPNEKQVDFITVEFDRVIREEQIDDLVEMIEFMITTLRRL